MVVHLETVAEDAKAGHKAEDDDHGPPTPTNARVSVSSSSNGSGGSTPVDLTGGEKRFLRDKKPLEHPIVTELKSSGSEGSSSSGGDAADASAAVAGTVVNPDSDGE